MDWLTSLFGPYPDIPPAAIAVPFLLALVAVINFGDKERNRKGWHPITKGLAWFFGIFVLVVGAIWLGQAFGLISSPSPKAL